MEHNNEKKREKPIVRALGLVDAGAEDIGEVLDTMESEGYDRDELDRVKAIVGGAMAQKMPRDTK